MSEALYECGHGLYISKDKNVVSKVRLVISPHEEVIVGEGLTVYIVVVFDETEFRDLFFHGLGLVLVLLTLLVIGITRRTTLIVLIKFLSMGKVSSEDEGFITSLYFVVYWVYQDFKKIKGTLYII